MTDKNKICFVTNVNDEFLYKEALLYLQNLHLPEGMSAEVVGVREAESMTMGYQQAMLSSDAKYKIYLHQDIFVVNPHILTQLLSIFRSDASIGMVGLAGSGSLSKENPVWWDCQPLYGSVYSKLFDEAIQKDVFGMVPGGEGAVADVAAADGIFLATQYDLPWRTDLFRGWHFYDIAQCREFIEAGYRVVVPHQEEPWVVHACGHRPVDGEYAVNKAIFMENYRWQEPGEI